MSNIFRIKILAGHISGLHNGINITYILYYYELIEDW